MYGIKKKFFLLILCFQAFAFAWAQTSLPRTFEIYSGKEKFTVLPTSNLQSLADQSGSLTLNEVLKSNFFTSNNNINSYKTQVYWQRFRLQNTNPEKVKIALPAVAHIVDLYTKSLDGEWEHYKTGTGVRWSQRDGLKRIPAFLVTIPGGETLTFYKRVYWNFLAAQPSSMPVTFSPAEKLIHHNYISGEAHYMTAIQNAFLLGMFILSMIINFYFFIIVREKEFLFFSLLLVSISLLAISSLNDIFFRENPQVALYIYLFANSISGFFMLHFVRYFLKTFRRFPAWDTYLVIFSFVQILVLLFAGFSSAIFQSNLSEVSHVSENVIKLIYGCSLLITLLLYARTRNTITRLMLVALAPILLLHVLSYSMAVILGLYFPRFGAQDISGYESGFNSIAFFILIICYLWMMIVFTWVLFLRFSNLRKQFAQQASLDHLKSRFFANISHEFRTPLTLIIGPVEDMLEEKGIQKFREPLSYVHRNAKRLLQLINQLLDLSKLDVGNYQVNATREDILPFVKQIVHSFSSLAHRKNILLETEVDPNLKKALRNEDSVFYFDEDILEKILYNLLSNAFKFTPQGGNITVSIGRADKNQLELKVEDSGMGIPAEKLPYVFDRFYQVDNSHKKQYDGTGIGLALVKELVTLHQGTIKVESTLDAGTAFGCYFPLNNKILSGKKSLGISTFEATDRGEEIKIQNEEYSADTGRPKALVVEDQQDVRKYICGKLEENYLVLEAKNGMEGFEMAKDQMPDIVISDVMMPRLDGFDLCKLLKTNDLTSHIPVILLTARSEDADKLAGLETGADAYLIKPFNSKELLQRVHNLIQLRNALRKQFSNKLVVRPSEISVTSQDSRFMQRLLEMVEKHIADEKFTVEQLAREFGLSPSQINRKLKAIINQSAVEFIRSIRMERAMELLKNNQATIAEVAYETGFSEPAYFSRVFKTHFGHSPSEISSIPNSNWGQRKKN